MDEKIVCLLHTEKYFKHVFQFAIVFPERLFVKHKQNITKLKPVYDNIKYWKETSIYTNITDNKIFNSGSSREVRRRYEISATSFVWIMKICEIG